jgi:hypothetical protein
MSGEGASWAGKNYRSGSLSEWTAIAYGSSLEQTFPGDFAGLPGGMCHRSHSAAMFSGESDTIGKNLACSGAKSYSDTNEDGVYKPGLDFANGTGQAAQLQQFATEVTRNGDELPIVMVSIGGNDAGFADVITYCAKRFVIPLASACWKSANDTSTPVGAALANLPTVRENVAQAFSNIKQALDAAGRPADSYRLVYQLPPMPVPTSSQMWPALGGDHSWGRQDYGGCPFTDGDLTFFHTSLYPKLTGAMVDAVRQAQQGPLAGVDITVLAPSFAGHELCNAASPPKNNGTNLNTNDPPFDEYSGQGSAWIAPIIMNCIALSPDASCATQRYPSIMQSVSGRVADAATLPVHPTYWGQRALAACHDLVQSDDTLVGTIASCAPAASGEQLGLDEAGRPLMVISGQQPL